MKRVWFLAGITALVVLFLAASGPSILHAGQQAGAGGSQIVSLTGYMIVPDQLEKSVAFYHNLLGLQLPNGDPRIKLHWYDTVPFLTEMYGVKEKTRNMTLRIPGADIGVEPMQWEASKGKLLNQRVQDPGSGMLVLTVRDLDELLGYMTKGGVKVVTTGGKPVAFNNSDGKGRAVVVQDFHGYFVKLVEPEMIAPAPGANGAGPGAYIIGAQVAAAVQDTEKAAHFYQDVLGVKVQLGDGFQSDPNELAILGLKGNVQYRHSVVMFPAKNQLHLYEFKGIDRKPIHPGIIDPGAVVLRVAVRNIDALYTKLKAANADIVSLSGGVYLNGRTKWLMLRDPDNLYVQPVEQPQQANP